MAKAKGTTATDDVSTAKPKPIAVKGAKITKAVRGGARGGSKTLKSKPPSIYQSVMAANYDTVPVTTVARRMDDPRSVLNRATNRAKHFKRLNPALCSSITTISKPGALEPAQAMQDQVRGAGLLDESNNLAKKDVNLFSVLPEDLRKRIFALAVVDRHHLVYPVSTTCQEQPDLAMTCRKIREEVLPLYYAENIFALEIHGLRSLVRKRMPSMVKWLEVLAKGGWLQHIRHWAFIDEVVLAPAVEGVEPEMVANMKKKRLLPEAVVISIVLPEHSTSHGPLDTAESSQKLELPVDASAERSAARPSPVIEVHHDAMCLLSRAAHGKHSCILQHNPEWLNEIVIETEVPVFTADSVVGMMEQFDEQRFEILGLRCNKEIEA